MSIADNLLRTKNTLPENGKLIAVSKTKPESAILEAFNAGQLCFGENKVQEMSAKYERLPKEIEWHFIGHLQTNKVKFIAPFVSLIHSVDSMKLLKTINGEAGRCNRVISCLLQFHIAQEDSKFGLSLDNAEKMLTSDEFKSMQNIQIAGVMGMATFTDDTGRIANEFDILFQIFRDLKARFFPENDNFREISMGMSDDYPIAMAKGSTMVRIGSSIFGSRIYQ